MGFSRVKLLQKLSFLHEQMHGPTRKVCVQIEFLLPWPSNISPRFCSLPHWPLNVTSAFWLLALEENKACAWPWGRSATLDLFSVSTPWVTVLIGINRVWLNTPRYIYISMDPCTSSPYHAGLLICMSYGQYLSMNFQGSKVRFYCPYVHIYGCISHLGRPSGRRTCSREYSPHVSPPDVFIVINKWMINL